jgi:hypothetical protein
MHRQVVELLREDALHHLMDQFATGAPSLPRKIFSPLSTDGESRPTITGEETSDYDVVGETARRKARPLFFAFSTLAATLLIAWGATAWQRRAGLNDADDRSLTVGGRNEAQDAQDSTQIIATVTRLIDAVWKPEAPQFHHGEQLAASSRVALQSGMIKVTYECGAEVVLEGPCEFVVDGKMVGVLRSGKITADVPRRAFAFAILAPGVDFVDLGTSFGLNVSEGGSSELHVFDGEVLCNQTGAADGADDLIHVTADKAMGFAKGANGPSDIAMDKQQFSQLIALRKGEGVEAQHWTGDQLALWLAADASVSADKKKRVIAWRDIVHADNRSAEDAIQAEENARPALVADAVNGHPGVRFDGNSDFLLTTPLQTTDDQTVLFVCQFGPNAFEKGRRWGGQIINYDGPPSRYLSDTLEPGVLQIGEPLLQEQFRPSLLTGQVFAGFIASTTVEAGRIDAAPIGPDTPVIVSYTYDYGRGKAELRINGRSYGEARAFAPQAITSRKIIGRHAWMQNFFHGDLAELMIYNTALSSPELAQVTAYLAEKYSISLEDGVWKPTAADK